VVRAELVADARCGVGEGPIWSAASRTVAWTDQLAPVLHRFSELDAAWSQVPVTEPLMCLIPSADGAFVRASARTVTVTGLGAASGPVYELADRSARFNDGAADAAGRLWMGTKSVNGTPGLGALLRVDGTDATAVLTGMGTPNGIGWSPDGATMYVSDSTIGRIDAFDFDASSGSLGASRPFAMIDPTDGRPDGLAVDVEGGVWSALWGGGRVVRLTPSGALEAVIELPVPLVTSCAFGGPELDRLYITTARLDTDTPGAGGLFALDVGIRGLSVGRYRASPDKGRDELGSAL
jgi:sugar lactone lactonase YvrE